MAYNKDLYAVDREKGFDPNASIKDGALLYRITSRKWCDDRNILTGNGAHYGPGEGRFHRINQRTTYCAENAMVCLSEMLYRLYRGMLKGIKDKLPDANLKRLTSKNYVLVIMSVGKIADLVYADSLGARAYHRHITGPSITCPDSEYEPLQIFSDAVRGDYKNGVVYPSARHSEGLAFALFKDETGKLKPSPYEKLELRLQLISEGQDYIINPPATLAARPPQFNITNDKLHPTVGYYEFRNPRVFNNLKNQGLINPDGLSERGYLDFVRRRYDKAIYPAKAHWPCK